METSDYILIGLILGPTGLQGALRFRFYAESFDTLKSYKVFYDQAEQRQFRVKKISTYKTNTVTLYLEGITTLTQAQELKGVSLYVKHEQLKKLAQDEYYYHDIKGLVVKDEEKKEIGYIEKVSNYGSGPLLEIILQDTVLKSALVPFRKEFIKEVNLEKGYVLVDTLYFKAFCELEGKN
jgi:16S rRNA processing protein RimM